MVPVTVYASERRALRRQRGIISEFGIWPGVVRHPDGTFTLTWEPEWWEMKEDYAPVKLPDNPAWAFTEDMERYEWLPDD